MTVAVKIYSGDNWINHFAVLGCAVPLADTLLPTVMEFPCAIKMTSRAALMGLSKVKILRKPVRQYTIKRRTQFL